MSESIYRDKRDYTDQFVRQKERQEARKLKACKTVSVKIQENKLNATQREYLTRIFLEAKWDYNARVAFGKSSPDAKPWKADTKSTTVIHLGKDGNKVTETFKFLTASMRQEANKKLLTAAKAIKTSKTRGRIKGSHGFKFKSEVNSVSLRQFGHEYRIKGQSIKLPKCGTPFKVRGLEQLVGLEELEFANARLLRKPSGYYIQIVIYCKKEERKHNYKTLGVDFGCSHTFSLYELETGKVQQLNFWLGESERLKRLQRKLNRRHNKGYSNDTNKGWRLRLALRKEYERLSRKKDNDAKQLVSLFKKYELVCYQDEQIKSWTRRYGKVVQHSILGRVKSLLEGQDNTFKLSKWLPTSKFCFDCFSKHDDLQLLDREFACPNCGCVSDRDLHAAKNMIYFTLVVKGIESLIKENKVPTEYREPRKLVEALLAFGKRVETSSSVEGLISDFLQELSLRHEAHDWVFHNEALTLEEGGAE